MKEHHLALSHGLFSCHIVKMVGYSSAKLIIVSGRMTIGLNSCIKGTPRVLCKLTWKCRQGVKVVADLISPFQTSNSLLHVVSRWSVDLGEVKQALRIFFVLHSVSHCFFNPMMSSHFCSVFIWSAKLFPALELCGNTVYVLSFSRM